MAKPGSMTGTGGPQAQLFPLAERASPPRAASAGPRGRKAKPVAGAGTEAGGQFLRAVEVAVAAHTGLWTYGVPAALEGRTPPGARVTVPLRGRLTVGLVVRELAAGEVGLALRPVVAVADALPADLMETVRFVARYYQAPVGDAARLVLPAPLRHTGVDGDEAPVKREQWVACTGEPWPPGLGRASLRVLQTIHNAGELEVRALRRQRQTPQTLLDELADQGLVRLWHAQVLRDPLGMREPVPPDQPPVLTSGQRLAVDKLTGQVDQRQFGGFLLRGVTGSGKTEVYLRTIEHALAQGRGAIVLVPEIALTPELVRRFRARFGDQVAALHSGMGPGERHDQQQLVASGERRIVVGPRSALLAPMADLGVVIVDECHDASFKQNNGLRYHARDVALFRARAAGAVCVLGSATPGCEEVWLARQNRLQTLELPLRATGGALPHARVVDLRSAPRLRTGEDQRPSLLSEELVEAVAATVARGEQAMLLHNRRGWATSMICQGCGAALECPDCAVTLTLHKRQHRLRCHWCELSLPVDTSCPHCHGRRLLGIGEGTERIEETLTAALPQLRVARFDRDTAAGQKLHDTLAGFRRGELDVLVGTQMLAKGHDFPSVTLVGVLLAESGLRVPDFRAAERTFQLLTQVAGRAGRGARAGQVLVQTYAPDHPAIVAALRHDHAGFVEDELRIRREQAQPPFSHLALLETRHDDERRALAAMTLAVDALRAWGAEVRGPIHAGVPRWQGVWRLHALVRSSDRATLHGLLSKLRATELGLPAGVELGVDVDPQVFQ
jgi:primosomal protein N' (replication factor Y)